MKFIDTHCHVHFEAYRDDMDEVVKRSLDAGVAMVTVGTQTATSKGAIELAERFEHVWATIGLHPNHLHKQEFFDQDELPKTEELPGKIKTRSESFDPHYYTELVSHPKVVAVGEFGLDFYRVPDHLDREEVIETQKQSCKDQLTFASQFEKPVVIHCRDAHEDQIVLLKQEIDNGGLRKRGVIHSFTGTIEDARNYQSLGFYLGLNCILTFSKELQMVISETPLSQIVIETDAPYLTPPPHRGKRNEPAYVPIIAEHIAELHNISVDEVAEATTYNASRLFNLSV